MALSGVIRGNHVSRRSFLSRRDGGGQEGEVARGGCVRLLLQERSRSGFVRVGRGVDLLERGFRISDRRHGDRILLLIQGGVHGESGVSRDLTQIRFCSGVYGGQEGGWVDGCG